MPTRRSMLSAARRYRTCPPPNMPHHPEYETDMDHHRRICPYCGIDADLTDWQALADVLTPAFSSEPGPVPDILPGQLRYILPERACWREGYFYSPPLVLIIENDPNIPDLVRAAQTYPEIGLAGPGDLILTADQTGFQDLFVECWNTYPLRSDSLGPVVGGVKQELTAAARQMETDPDALPPAALMPRPLKEEDPRRYFRELEVEVAYTFASRAVDSLLAGDVRPLLRLIDRPREELQEAIRERVPTVEWLWAPDSSEAVFALARSPADLLPMAASHSDDQVIPGNLFLLKNGRVELFKTVPVHILGRTPVEEGVEYFGQVDPIPGSVIDSILLGYLFCEEGFLRSPSEVEWDAAESRFRIVFADVDVWARCELTLAVVGEIE